MPLIIPAHHCLGESTARPQVQDCILALNFMVHFASIKWKERKHKFGQVTFVFPFQTALVLVRKKDLGIVEEKISPPMGKSNLCPIYSNIHSTLPIIDGPCPNWPRAIPTSTIADTIISYSCEFHFQANIQNNKIIRIGRKYDFSMSCSLSYLEFKQVSCSRNLVRVHRSMPLKW